MSIQLTCGDACDLMRSLPAESIDMIVTDVAYESLEEHRAKGSTTRLKVSDASSNEWFDIFHNDRFAEFFSEAYRVLKKDAHLYFFSDGKTSRVAIPVGEAAGFKFWNDITWVKTGDVVKAESLDPRDVRIGMGYHYRNAKELVLFFEKGKKRLADLSVPNVLCYPSVRNKYPTEKPVDLIRVFVRQSTVQGDVVLDPFMGSGSAGEAALRTGRSFIGGDIKQSAVDLAKTRLEALQRPG